MAKQEKEVEGPGCVEFTGPLISSFSSKGARDYQEDKVGFWINAENGHFLAVVADGAGGHGGGAEAAAAAVGAATLMWQETGGRISDGGDFLKEFMTAAHDAVKAEAKRITRSARSAVVAVAADGKRVHWVHAGDCRLYRVQGREILERTRDDSVVQVLFESGEITEEEMGDHPDQNRLLQSLGSDDPPTLRCGSTDLDERDVFLLCSDGLWENQSKGEIVDLAQVPQEDRDEAVKDAVTEAVQRAGKKADNTTALVVSLGPASAPGAERKGGAILILLLSLCLLAAMIFSMLKVLEYSRGSNFQDNESETLQPGNGQEELQEKAGKEQDPDRGSLPGGRAEQGDPQEP